MAQIAVATAGALVGGAVGGPVGAKIGWAIGAYVGGRLFGPDVPDTQGPRLDDLTVKGGNEGQDMVYVWGDVRTTSAYVFADNLKEIKTEEDVGGKGAPSATHTTFSYTLNFAVSFGKAGDGAPAKLRRLWANKKLIFDATADAKATNSGYVFTFYDGTQTLPDPVVESIVGAGNAPAYTGQLILVGYAWDLTKEFGNRPPTIEAEIVTNGSDLGAENSFQIMPNSDGTNGLYYSAATNSLWGGFAGTGGTIPARLIEIEPNTKQVITNKEMPWTGSIEPMLFSRPFVVGNEQYALVYSKNTGFEDSIVLLDLLNNTQQLARVELPNNYNQYQYIGESEQHVWAMQLQDGSGFFLVNFDKTDLFPSGTIAQNTFTPPTGYEFMQDPGGLYIANDGINFGKVFVPLNRLADNVIAWSFYDYVDWDINPSPTLTDLNTQFYRNPILADDGLIYVLVDIGGILSFQRLTVGGAEVDVIDLEALGLPGKSASGVGWPHLFYNREQRAIFLYSGDTIYRYNIDSGLLDSWTTGTLAHAWAYFDNGTQTVWGGIAVGGTATVYGWRVGIVGLGIYPVADILDDLSGYANLPAGAFDWSGVSQTVGGFFHSTQRAPKDNMTPLLQYSVSDAVSTGWQIKGVELGGSLVDTIDDGTTVRGNRLSQTKPQDIRLPNLCQIQYASSDNDLQPAMAAHEWYTARGSQAVQLALPLTLNDAEGATFAQQWLQLSYTQDTYQFELPPRYTALKPADPVSVDNGQRVKLTKIERGYNGVMQCEAIADNPNDLATNAPAPGSVVQPGTIPASSTPRLFIIDTPLLRDIDQDNPGPYLSAFTFGTGEPGIQFLASAGNNVYTNVSAIGTEPIVGVCETVPLPVDFEAIDTTNTLRITLRETGTLASATLDELLAGSNVAVWGGVGRWEVVQWQTASLVSPDVYDLSDLLRGRRGTDPFIDTHLADDWFVVVTQSTVIRHSLQNAAIGTERNYKAPKGGQVIADVQPYQWFVGTNPLRPYTPIELTGTPNAGDMDLTWTRRTRKGGVYGGPNNITDNVGGALSEESESYTVSTYTDAGVLITERTTTTPSLTLTAADIASDYGGPVNAIYYKVRQNSGVSSVRGFDTKLTVAYFVQPPDVVIPALNPDRYWKLDEQTGTTAVDASGNLGDGTYEPNVMLGQPGLTIDAGFSAQTNNALNWHVTIPTAMVNGSNAFSVVGFFRNVSTPGGAAYSARRRLRIEVGSPLSDRRMYCYVYTSDTVFVALDSGADTVFQDTNYAFAFTFGDEGGNNIGRLYLNGSEVANHNFGASTLFQGTDNSYIGAKLPDSASLEARHDRYAEWNGVTLTPQQVADIHAGLI